MGKRQESEARRQECQGPTTAPPKSWQYRDQAASEPWRGRSERRRREGVSGARSRSFWPVWTDCGWKQRSVSASRQRLIRAFRYPRRSSADGQTSRERLGPVSRAKPLYCPSCVEPYAGLRDLPTGSLDLARSHDVARGQVVLPCNPSATPAAKSFKGLGCKYLV